MENAIRFSFVVPVYEMRGKGSLFLEVLLDSLNSQTYEHFEVIVSDHSQNAELQQLCALRKYDRLTIRHNYRHGPLADNLNHAVALARGDYVKILFQDDRLAVANALDTIVNVVENTKAAWIANGWRDVIDGTYSSDRAPRIVRPGDPDLKGAIGCYCLRRYCIGSPSCQSVRKDCVLPFDARFRYFVDAEWYYRVAMTFGPPVCITDVLTEVAVGGHTVSSTVSRGEVLREGRLFQDKHDCCWAAVDTVPTNSWKALLGHLRWWHRLPRRRHASSVGTPIGQVTDRTEL